jgi:mitogen-activated protein kinase kinase kinase 1
MNTKHNRQRPRLDRRNAIKNIDYDASLSSSSTSLSFDEHSIPKIRSFDLSPLSEPLSFRMEGIDGEFDRICRTVGLSGPEDFAIPASAWVTRKVRSPSDNLGSDRFNSPVQTPVDDLAGSFGARVRVANELDTGMSQTRTEHEHSFPPRTFVHSVKVSDEAKLEYDIPVKTPVHSVMVSDELNSDMTERRAKHEQNIPVKTTVHSVRVRRPQGSESGIKGLRPPVLAPPVVESRSSVWELQPTKSYSNVLQENEGVDGVSVGLREANEEILSNGADLSESCSDSSNEDKDDEAGPRTSTELEYSISPNVRFNPDIMSWQKGDFLGSGSFGTVYEGYTDDGFFFAVKEVSLLDQGSQGKQSIYQLEQEISLLSRFKHENIVQYLGTNKDDGKLYIFLELVTKGSLEKLYQKYNLRDSQVSAYTRQILSGLSYLHARKVVHRDIKCANILVDVSGYVKLADFGLAKATTKLNDVKSCKGTPFWMAPEVVKGRSHGYGLAADIWSLGCTVLEMLTRQLPYSHLEGMQAIFRIGKGELPRIPESLSDDARDFILKCLQVNPGNRPSAIQLLNHQFVKKTPSFSSPRHSRS